MPKAKRIPTGKKAAKVQYFWLLPSHHVHLKPMVDRWAANRGKEARDPILQEAVELLVKEFSITEEKILSQVGQVRTCSSHHLAVHSHLTATTESQTVVQ